MRKNSIVFIFICLFGLFIFQVAFANITCSGCGKQITGRYGETVDGRKLCENCLPNCSSCGKKLIGRFKMVDGRILCEDCQKAYKKTLTCSSCRKEITGSYEVTNDRVFCEDCYQRIYKAVPECSLCGKKTASYYKKDGRVLCEKCYQKSILRCSNCGERITGSYRVKENKTLCEKCYSAVAPRCQICSKILEGKYFSLGGKYFCLSCYKTYPHCYSCGVPLSFSRHVLSDRRIVCPQCFKKVVLKQERLNSLFRQTQELMRDKLNLEVKNTDIEIILTDKNSIEKIAKQNNISLHDSSSLYTAKIDNGKIVQKIYVLKGLLPERVFAVLCRSYAYAWQTENCPADLKAEIKEGFAQWVAYRIMLSIGQQKEAESLLSNANLKLMLAKEKEAGLKGLLSYVTDRKGHQLPLAEQVRQQNEKIRQQNERARKFNTLMLIGSRIIILIFLLVLIFLAVKFLKRTVKPSSSFKGIISPKE